MQILTSPLFIQKSKKIKWFLNLNNYRNTHYLVLNRMKLKFKEIMHDQIMKMDIIEGSVVISYTIYPPTKRKFDISNPCSVIDKFLCDAITEYGKWDDDNYHIVRSVLYKFGAIDKQNPRCEIHIIPYEAIAKSV